MEREREREIMQFQGEIEKKLQHEKLEAIAGGSQLGHKSFAADLFCKSSE